MAEDFKFSLQKALDLFEDTWASDIGEDIVASHGEWKERQLANEFSNLLHSLLREGFFNDCEYYATTTSGSENSEDEEENDQEVTEYDRQRSMDDEHYDHDHDYDHDHGHHGHDHDHHGHHHYHAHHAVDDSCDSGRGYVEHYDSDVETPRSESFSLSSERRRQARGNDPSINMLVGSRRSRHQSNSRRPRGSGSHGRHSNHSSSQSETEYDDEDDEVDGSEESDEVQTRPNENNSVTGRVKRYLSKVLTKVKSGSSKSANSNKSDRRRG